MAYRELLTLSSRLGIMAFGNNAPEWYVMFSGGYRHERRHRLMFFFLQSYIAQDTDRMTSTCISFYTALPGSTQIDFLALKNK